MASPIQEAFNRIIEEIYWLDDLEEAERRLTAYLESMDDDLREILLEERRKYCSDPEVVIDIIRIEVLAENTEGEDEKKLLLLKSLIDTLFLAQCTRKWASLPPREKARVLAPLYRALYGFRLAAKNFPSSVDRMHLREAYANIEEAYERAEELGLLSQLYEKIEELSRKALEDMGVEEDEI